jgi:hypothetical protein
MLLNDCRIYICKPKFTEPDECIKFKNLEDYKNWSKENKDKVYNTSFIPICFKYTDYFDKLILMKRSKKLIIPYIFNLNKD